MSKVRQKVSKSDIRVGKVLWVSVTTNFEEGYIDGPAQIESINKDGVLFRLLFLPRCIGGERYHTMLLDRQKLLNEIASGDSRVSIPEPAKLKECLTKELGWISEQRQFLDRYLTALQAAMPL